MELEVGKTYLDGYGCLVTITGDSSIDGRKREFFFTENGTFSLHGSALHTIDRRRDLIIEVPKASYPDALDRRECEQTDWKTLYQTACEARKELQDTIEKLQARLETSIQLTEALTDERNELQDTIEALQDQIKILKRSNKYWFLTFDDARKELDDTRKELDDARKELEQLHKNNEPGETTSLRDQIAMSALNEDVSLRFYGSREEAKYAYADAMLETRKRTLKKHK